MNGDNKARLGWRHPLRVLNGKVQCLQACQQPQGIFPTSQCYPTHGPIEALALLGVSLFKHALCLSYTWEAGSSDGVFNHLIYHLPHLYLNKQPKRLLMTGSKRYLEKVFWDWLSEVIFVKPCFLVIWTHFQWTHRVHEIYLTMVLTKHDNIISYNVHIPPKKNLEHTSDYSIWNARWFVTLPV